MDFQQLSTIGLAELQMASAKTLSATSDKEKEAAYEEYARAFQRRNVAIEEALSHAIDPDTRQAHDLEAELLSLEAEELTSRSEANTTIATTKAAPYMAFMALRSKITGHLLVAESTLLSITSDQKHSDVDGLFATEQQWTPFALGIDKDLTTLAAHQVAIERSVVCADLDVESVRDRWTQISHELLPAARLAIQRVSEERAQTKDERDDLENERSRLLVWCRQQKTNLDAVTEHDHVQEFCASLLGNVPSMEENFTVLLERAEPLLSDTDVQKSLLEANEVWLNLQVSAYERLRHTLLEIHPKSKLEDEVREFSGYSAKIGLFFDHFAQLLSSPSDDESQKFVKPVLEECDKLRADFSSHSQLSNGMLEFSQRMECLRESYASLRRAVLSRLTFLASSVPALATSMRRKEEYVARMKDLKKWIEIKNQGESWKDIHQRVLSIKSLIETEQAALAETVKK